MAEITELSTDRCNPDDLKAGDWLSRISYMEVMGVTGDGVKVRNLAGTEWSISKSIIQAECYAAGQVREERSDSRTNIARDFVSSTNGAIVEVKFMKQVDPLKVAEKLASLTTAPSALPDKTRKVLAKELLQGEERVLVGYVLSTDEATGRVNVLDVKATGPVSGRKRQVDPRTIDYLIVRNIKTKVK